jgi:AcrR family transcriptional regulator
MGRKALKRERKTDLGKTSSWADILFPFFQENGIKGITMNKVAEVLNKSKTTLYDYFRTKEELLEFLIDKQLMQIETFSAILEDQKLSFVERHMKALEHLALHISGISTVFLADLRLHHPELWQKIEQFLDFASGILEKFYKQGISKGEFKNINPSLLVMSDRLFFRTLADPDFLTDADLTIKQAFEQYLEVKFFGLVKD